MLVGRTGNIEGGVSLPVLQCVCHSTLCSAQQSYQENASTSLPRASNCREVLALLRAKSRRAFQECLTKVPSLRCPSGRISKLRTGMSYVHFSCPSNAAVPNLLAPVSFYSPFVLENRCMEKEHLLLQLQPKLLIWLHPAPQHLSFMHKSL